MSNFILRDMETKNIDLGRIEKICKISVSDKKLFRCFDSYFKISGHQSVEKHLEDNFYLEELLFQSEDKDLEVLIDFFEKDVLNIKLPRNFVLGMVGYYEQTYNIRCLSLCLLIFKVYYPNEELRSITEFFNLQKGLDGKYGYLNPVIYQEIDDDERGAFRNFITVLAELCLYIENGEI
ncbi:hypothetical protein AB9M75_03405 [Lactobacillus sp. AN1001]